MRKRDIYIVIGAICAALLLGLPAVLGTVLPTGSWGLSFQTQGAAPNGPATSAQLARYDGAYLGDTEEKVIYLTFDAGYENGCTGKILDVLKKHQVEAAFFLVGNYMEQNPDLVRRMVQEGHTVGNHTMHHKDMSKISEPAVFEKELRDLENLYRQITGQELPKYYRPPQGVYSDTNLQMAKELGYKTVFWSLAYVDWKQDDQPDPKQALEKLLLRTHNGAVVLLHSTSTTNAEILDQLLTRWKDQGYRLAGIEELFSADTAKKTQEEFSEII